MIQWEHHNCHSYSGDEFAMKGKWESDSSVGSFIDRLERAGTGNNGVPIKELYKE